MSDHSKFEWTDATWNPVRGCTKISPGCARCYAETFAERFRGVPGHPYEQGFDLRLVPGKLDDPLRWRKPRRVFVNSMSDLFHSDVDDGYIARVVDVMRRADWHVYHVLTKRSERMRDLLAGRFRAAADWPHAWWGVSVEDRAHGLPRVGHLRAAPARNRFLSVEPLLEDLGDFDLSGIRWVIAGGESGPGARPCRVEWVRTLVRRCKAADVPVFVKQLGARPQGIAATDRVPRSGVEPGGGRRRNPTPELLDAAPLRLVDRRGGDPAEWPEDLRVREFPGHV